MKERELPTITIRIDDFIDYYLADSSDRPIKPSLAKVVETLSANTLLCHIQWPEDIPSPEDGINETNVPILWRYKDWANSEERRDKSRKRAEEARIKRFIFEENLKRVSQKVEDWLTGDLGINMDMDRCREIATSYILNPTKYHKELERLNIKLITRKEEL